jgi:3',5'-cyclic AMP phosphodiesterase CpdA
MSFSERSNGLRFLTPLCLLAAAISGSPLLAQQSDRPKPVAAESYRPTVFPDRIILTIAGDPAHTQAVTWRTDATAASGQGQIAPADHGPQFEAKAKSVAATTQALTTEAGDVRYHTVVFAGLEPSTRYLYRVGDGSRWSEWITFQTAAAGAEPFRFLYVGDAQNSIKSHWSRVIRAAFAAAPKARFIVHAGDLVGRGTNDTDWGEWYQAAGWINAMVPSLPAPGNHEYEKTREERAAAGAGAATITPLWRAQFALPTNGPKGLEETAYHVDYQGVRIVVLNSNEGQQKQADWLHDVLGQNPNHWTVVVFHHPIYASAKGRNNVEVRKLWQPIFDQYHVDLVLQGHDHTYARTGLQTTAKDEANGSTPNPRAGTVYVNSVSGPKQYVLDRKPAQLRTAEGTQLFQVITVNGETLRLEARTALGELYDAFDLHKRPGQANELVEKGPGTPERHPVAPAEKDEKPAARKAAAAAR